MNIYCPYCGSEHVIQMVQSQQSSGNNSSLASSASFATMGASLSKVLPLPVSPLVGGIAGAVVGGLLGSLFDEPKPQLMSIRYFHCQHCQRDFQ